MIKTRTGVHAPARYLMALFAVLAGVLAPAPALLIHAAPQAVPGVDPNFYKLTVSQTGLVRVTYESLQAAGLPVTTLDLVLSLSKHPATFQLYEQGVEIARQVVDAACVEPVETTAAGRSPPAITSCVEPVETFVLRPGGGHLLHRHQCLLADLWRGAWVGYGDARRHATERAAACVEPVETAVTTFLETLHFEQNTLFESALPVSGDADHWYWQILVLSLSKHTSLTAHAGSPARRSLSASRPTWAGWRAVSTRRGRVPR